MLLWNSAFNSPTGLHLLDPTLRGMFTVPSDEQTEWSVRGLGRIDLADPGTNSTADVDGVGKSSTVHQRQDLG